jgi:hypothetical protein
MASEGIGEGVTLLLEWKGTPKAIPGIPYRHV